MDATLPVTVMMLISVFQSMSKISITFPILMSPLSQFLKFKTSSLYGETFCPYHPVTVNHPVTSLTTLSQGHFVKSLMKENEMLHKLMHNDVRIVWTNQINVTLLVIFK